MKHSNRNRFQEVATWITLVLTLLGAGVYLGQIRPNLAALHKDPGTEGPEVERPPTDSLHPSEIVRISFENGADWGNWSEIKYCPKETYVCGMRQRVEPSQGKGDDTAMNAVEFYCCPF